MQDGLLPIKVDTTSNGEFVPFALPALAEAANREARTLIEDRARHLGLTRRRFLSSTAAAATALFAFSHVHAAAGRRGGAFAIDLAATFDEDAAVAALGGREFIFDVQGHYVVPPSLVATLKPRCRTSAVDLSRNYMRCLGADDFIKDIFLDSDTAMMVLSFVPSRRDAEPLTIAEAAATRAIVEQLEGTQRLLLHGRVAPNQPGDLDDMDELAERWGVVAWKCYTQWGPDGQGFALTDEATGVAMIERGRKLGVRTVCVHKGIPFGRQSYEHSTCSDIGPIAARFPDVNFLVYHSGYVPGRAEGPYDPSRGEGCDELIRSVEAAGLAPGSNVYAELGTTWRTLMRDTEEAAHCLGKLLKHLGPDNVLYGSDCVWYGSPQDQIQALRAFQISEEFQARYGYPALTPRLKAKLFGLNAARVYGIDVEEIGRRARGDKVARAREEYRNHPTPDFGTRGPRTREEFAALINGRKGPL